VANGRETSTVDALNAGTSAIARAEQHEAAEMRSPDVGAVLQREQCPPAVGSTERRSCIEQPLTQEHAANAGAASDTIVASSTIVVISLRVQEAMRRLGS
jgi:hypothetical protein